MPELQEATVALPEPRRKSSVSVEEALASRRSRRAYRSDPMLLANLGQLLWAAQGITGPEGQRTAPSAGALYPLELYVSASRVEGLAPGIYHYAPETHSLQLHLAGDQRRALTAAAQDQDCVRFAPCTLIFAAVLARTTEKYGKNASRYVSMEAAHASENVYLQAAALGLGTCVVGAFEPAEVHRVAQLPGDEHAAYLMTAGRPA